MIIDDFMKYARLYDLLIFDINGVLDNNHDAKEATLHDAFPELNQLQISKINVDMERAYEHNKSDSTSSHIMSALKDNDISVLDEEAKVLEQRYYDLNRIKPEIIQCLNNLTKTNKVCLYTSLSKPKVEYIASLASLSPNIMIFSREEQIESKPSIRNLEKILELNNTTADRAVLFGDNVAVDIMPAHLLGIKAVLVSNYVDDIIKL